MAEEKLNKKFAALIEEGFVMVHVRVHLNDITQKFETRISFLDIKMLDGESEESRTIRHKERAMNLFERDLDVYDPSRFGCTRAEALDKMEIEYCYCEDFSHVSFVYDCDCQL